MAAQAASLRPHERGKPVVESGQRMKDAQEKKVAGTESDAAVRKAADEHADAESEERKRDRRDGKRDGYQPDAQTPNRLVQLDHLKAKVDAGADYIVTQLFFDNRAFFDWQEQVRLRGIDVPIFAGIMQITSIEGMKRMADLSGGTNFPASLQRSIYRCQDNPEAVARVGVHWATEQCRDLIDRGVRGIHFYTLNKSDATRKIYETRGVTRAKK